MDCPLLGDRGEGGAGADEINALSDMLDLPGLPGLEEVDMDDLAAAGLIGAAAPSNGLPCCGPQLSMTDPSLCTPGFFAGTGHFKNKFCPNCRATGLLVKTDRVRALTSQQHNLFQNQQQHGLWSSVKPAESSELSALRFRLINQTQKCTGPRLIILKSATSLPMAWGELPPRWVRQGEWVHLMVSKGTLAPVYGDDDSAGQQYGALSHKRSRSASESPARSSCDAVSTASAAERSESRGEASSEAHPEALAQAHERLVQLVMSQFDRPLAEQEADGVDDEQRSAFLSLLVPLRASATLLRREARPALITESTAEAEDSRGGRGRAAPPAPAPTDDQVIALREKLFGSLHAAATSRELCLGCRGLTDAEIGHLAFVLLMPQVASAAGGGPAGGRANEAPPVAPSDLTKLNLTSNYLTAVAAGHLVPVLRAAAGLTCLDISNNTLADDGARRLMGALTESRMASLRCLRLRHCQLSCTAAAELAKALSATGAPALEELTLNGNFLRDAGIVSIAGGIVSLPAGLLQLRTLCLGTGVEGNVIGDAGLRACVQALEAARLPRLAHLAMANNLVTDDGASALTEALRRGAAPSLMLINLQSNRISDGGVAALSAACRRPDGSKRLLLAKPQLTS